MIQNFQRTETIEFLFSKIDFEFAHFALCPTVLFVSTQRNDMFTVCDIISKTSFVREGRMLGYPSKQSQIPRVISF